RPGQMLTITPEERRLNMQACANDKQNLFLNGSFVPVTLLDDDTRAEFASNPNALSEGDLGGLLSMKIADFRKKVSEIDNIYALDRLLELSDEEDTKATIKHVDALRARRDEVAPSKPKP